MIVGLLVLFGVLLAARPAAQGWMSCHAAYRTAVAANFFTMASSSLRSLSFRLVE